MTAPSPKPRREVQIDLSGLSDRQAIARERVIRLGELAYGPRWQSDLAAALGAEVRRPVAQAQVAHWISGRRPVPEALSEPLHRLALSIADDMARRVDRIRADWSPGPPGDEDAALASLSPRD